MLDTHILPARQRPSTPHSPEHNPDVNADVRERHQHAPDIRRCELRDVHRGDHHRTPHSDPGHHPAHQEEREAVAHRHHGRARDENDARERRGRFPAEAIGCLAREEAPEGRHDIEGPHHHFLRGLEETDVVGGWKHTAKHGGEAVMRGNKGRRGVQQHAATDGGEERNEVER